MNEMLTATLETLRRDGYAAWCRPGRMGKHWNDAERFMRDARMCEAREDERGWFWPR